MTDAFLCEDLDCWISPERAAGDRRARRPALACEPVVLYTPIDLGDGANWVADTLAPRPSRKLDDLAVRTDTARIELADGRALTALVGPIGAPATVATLEMAIALGARTLLFFGICGSLQPDLRIGDLVLADGTIREEGTSFHYLPPGRAAAGSPRLLEAASGLLCEADAPFRRGTIWTTDAPYRETRTKVKRLAEAGVLGVEMETSAVYALASYRGVEALSLQVVSDELVGEHWTGISRETFRERCHTAVELMARLAERL